MKALQINLIPDDASHNYREALGYPWQDLENRIPGDDRRFAGRTARETLDAVKAEMTEKYPTIQYIDRDNWMALPNGAEVVVSITGMWCGGVDLLGYVAKDAAKQTPKGESAGSTLEETATLAALSEGLDLEEQDARYADRPGYCRKCHTFCYGDCEAK